MSEGEEKGGWWGSWVKSAKDKSLSALNMVKKDLAEFSSVMHDDTVKAASKVKEKLTQENATAATEKVKQGVSHLLGGISKALIVEPDDNYQPAQIVGGEAIVFDRYKARLHAIQIDPSTYITEPSGDSYEQWLSTTNLDSMKGDISDLLVSNVEVRALYTQLVPCTVPNIEFWRRYYYRRHLLEEDEARRLELMKRADDTKDEKDLGWDEDDDDWTEARALSTGTEPGDAKLAHVAKTVSIEAGGSSDDGFTTVQLSSNASDDRHTEEMTNTQIPVDTSGSDDSTVEDSPVEVSETPKEEAELETISRPETSSSNFSEVAAPPSDNSMELLSVAAVGDVQSLKSTHSSDPSLSGWSGLSDAKSVDDDSSRLTTIDKLVAVESSHGRNTPSDDSSNAKESLDDEWEKDFEVEVTEEDLIAAQNSLKKADASNPGSGDVAEDWEDW